ncbi:MAG: YfhO family protein [Pirellulaceae bacterium]|nr:YfhO family protein [Pirellulaceae bacterium]
MNRHVAVLSWASVVLIPLLACFGGPVVRGETFVLQDTARFYYPLFAWTHDQWMRGRIPLWNPQENCGMPVVGDTTSSVFYPGKLIFLLPGGFNSNFNWYVVLHVLAAAVSALLAARSWRASPPAAACCALAYAFGGYTLYQYTNVVFLVGAAWLPLSLLAADRMLRRRSLKWSVLLGVALAMLTLGGDPQTAYHVGLLAAAYGLLLSWLVRRRHRRLRSIRAASPSSRHDGPRAAHRPARRSSPGRSNPPTKQAGAKQRPASIHWFASCWQSGRRGTRRRAVLLAAAATTGACLAAIQIVPSMQWNARSERTAFRAPRNLFQVPAVLRREASRPLAADSPATADRGGNPWHLVGQGLLGSPEPYSHHRNLYRYSIQPWRLVELLWPNIGGKPFPVNRRLLLAWNAAEPDWTPSLYLGLVPVLLGLSAWSLRGSSLRTRWISGWVLLAILASFGWYGPGWCLRACQGLAAADAGAASQPWLGEPVGGVYWLLVTLLPGYDQFRYPAKWFLFATFGLALLSARGWDRLVRRPCPALRLALAWTVTSALALGIALLMRPTITGWLRSVLADELHGPLVAEQAGWDLVLVMLHATLVGGLGWWLLRQMSRTAKLGPRVGLLLLTACELAWAQGWLVVTGPADIWRDRPWAAARIDMHAAELPPSGYRVMRRAWSNWNPAEWTKRSDARRSAEGLLWHRETLFPRTILTTPLSMLESPSSVMSDDFQSAIGIARQFGSAGPGQAPEPHTLFLSTLGVRYLIEPAGATASARPAGFEPLANATSAERNAAVLFNPHHLPRSWIVHRVEQLPRLDTTDPQVLDALTAHVFFPQERFRDLRHEAVVEVGRAPLPVVPVQPDAPNDEACRVVRYEPRRVDIQAALASPGLVVLSDLYDADWRARVIPATGERAVPVEVLRTNRIMRGVFLPAGRFTVEYTYQPRGFWWAAAVSALSWCSLAIGGLLARFRRARCGQTSE